MIPCGDAVAKLDIQVQQDVTWTKLHRERRPYGTDARIAADDSCDIVNNRRARAFAKQQAPAFEGERERGAREDQSDGYGGAGIKGRIGVCVAQEYACGGKEESDECGRVLDQYGKYRRVLA